LDQVAVFFASIFAAAATALQFLGVHERVGIGGHTKVPGAMHTCSFWPIFINSGVLVDTNSALFFNRNSWRRRCGSVLYRTDQGYPVFTPPSAARQCGCHEKNDQTDDPMERDPAA